MSQSLKWRTALVVVVAGLGILFLILDFTPKVNFRPEKMLGPTFITFMSVLKKTPARSKEGYPCGCGLHPHIPVLLSQLTFFQWIHSVQCK